MRSLRETILARIAERRWSLRELARRSGVAHTTLSRALRGKSRLTDRLVAAVSGPLGLHAGAAVGRPEPDAARLAHGEAGAACDTWEALAALGVDGAVDAARVEARLRRLAEYAATDEARLIASEGLERKIAALGARGPVIERIRALFAMYLERDDVPVEVRAAAGSAILYFLLPVDDIDDYIFPVGYLDDAVAVAIAERRIHALQEHGAR